MRVCTVRSAVCRSVCMVARKIGRAGMRIIGEVLTHFWDSTQLWVVSELCVENHIGNGWMSENERSPFHPHPFGGRHSMGSMVSSVGMSSVLIRVRIIFPQLGHVKK